MKYTFLFLITTAFLLDVRAISAQDSSHKKLSAKVEYLEVRLNDLEVLLDKINLRIQIEKSPKSNENHDQLISKLGSKNILTAGIAWRDLNRAGKDAFPALLRRMNDKTIANRQVVPQESNMYAQLAGGTSIGRTCYLLIKDQLEFHRPRYKSRTTVLTPANVKEWLQKHEKLSIHKMQIVMAKEILVKICQNVSEHGLISNNIDELHEVTNGLRRLQKAKEPNTDLWELLRDRDKRP